MSAMHTISGPYSSSWSCHITQLQSWPRASHSSFLWLAYTIMFCTIKPLGYLKGSNNIEKLLLDSSILPLHVIQLSPKECYWSVVLSFDCMQLIITSIGTYLKMQIKIFISHNEIMGNKIFYFLKGMPMHWFPVDLLFLGTIHLSHLGVTTTPY